MYFNQQAMSVLVKAVQIQNNPASFNSPLSLVITTECISSIKNDLEWKLTYVGSADSEEHDQVLDSVLVGPVPMGISQFVFEADPPKWDQIPKHDLLGVTILLLTCSYKEQEFVRIGYYVKNDYNDPALREEPPEEIKIESVERLILDSKPRITLFKINWDDQMKDNFDFEEFDKENEKMMQEIGEEVIEENNSDEMMI